MIDAVIATEDHDFYNHPGVDVGGILRAAYTDLVKREHGAGRLDDHRAAREERLRRLLLDRRERRADLRPAAAFGPGEDPRGAARGEARATARQGPDPRDLPQHGLLRARRLRGRGRRADVLRQALRASSRSWSRPRSPGCCTRPSSTIRSIARATTGTGATTRSTRWCGTATWQKAEGDRLEKHDVLRHDRRSDQDLLVAPGQSEYFVVLRPQAAVRPVRRGRGVLGRHARDDDPGPRPAAGGRARDRRRAPGRRQRPRGRARVDRSRRRARSSRWPADATGPRTR